MKPIVQLLNILNVKPTGQLCYQGNNVDIGLKQTFGGQLIGQAIMAASQTVPETRSLHSLHCYFLLPGDNNYPIDYKISLLRDGQSFSSRQTTAIQHDRNIFYAMSGFQETEISTELQPKMPQVPSYSTLTADHIVMQQIAEEFPHKFSQFLAQTPPIEMRSVQFIHPFKADVTTNTRHVWFKINGDITKNPLNPQALLGYFCDFHLLPTALQPLKLPFFTPNLQIATLEHSMWFHRPVDINKWLLFYTEVIDYSNHRALVKGEIFDEHGRLIATCMQQGIIRIFTR